VVSRPSHAPLAPGESDPPTAVDPGKLFAFALVLPWAVVDAAAASTDPQLYLFANDL